jgi:hypothetical protein
MSMSRDRVVFKITGYRLNHSAKESGIYRRLLLDIFGIDVGQEGITTEELTITCRPSQFARFLIRREELGGSNQFKELDAKLVPGPKVVPIKPRTEFDVSAYPA